MFILQDLFWSLIRNSLYIIQFYKKKKKCLKNLWRKFVKNYLNIFKIHFSTVQTKMFRILFRKLHSWKISCKLQFKSRTGPTFKQLEQDVQYTYKTGQYIKGLSPFWGDYNSVLYSTCWNWTLKLTVLSIYQSKTFFVRIQALILCRSTD